MAMGFLWMYCVRVVLAFVCLCAVLAGCAKPPQRLEQSATLNAQELPAQEAQTPTITATKVAANIAVDYETKTASVIRGPSSHKYFGHRLAGRKLSVEQQTDIKLASKEVVITFDDGPSPGKTEQILAALKAQNVKATFLMLGRAAKKHPDLVRKVAKAGHTIGLHTNSHGNLTKVNLVAALAEIERGRRPLVAALENTGYAPAPFFRFPYLAQTKRLRNAVNNAGLVIMDVQVDSKDYYSSSSKAVLKRTLARLENQDKGIVLFHDIHQRTVEMLPEFLEALRERGYKVVSLVPDRALVQRSNAQLASND